MKRSAVELKVSDWQMNAWISLELKASECVDLVGL